MVDETQPLEIADDEIDSILSKSSSRSGKWDKEALLSLLDKEKGVVTLEDVRDLYNGDKYSGYKNAERCLLWGALNIINRHFKKSGVGFAKAVYSKLAIVYSKTFERATETEVVAE